VASDVTGSGMTWVVQAEKTGVLVPPQSVTALRQALLYLHHHPKQCLMYGRAGQQRFLQTFEILPVAQQIHLLYQKI
jgi:rhamnosyl/mannosyltransferase